MLVEEQADGFGWVAEGGVRAVHRHLRDERDDGASDLVVAQAAADRALQVVADVALGAGGEGVEGQRRVSHRIHVVSQFVVGGQLADLGAVPYFKSFRY